MKSHLKQLVMPKSWTLFKKGNMFVIKSKPGAHQLQFSMPLALLLKNMGYAATTREAKKILNTKEVLVDGRRIKEHKFPVGFMDVITIADTKDVMRVLLDESGKLKIVPIDKEESALKLCSVKKKTAIAKGKTQINLSDNRNILVDKDEYKTGDSVLITIPFQEIKQHLPLEKGALIYLIGGKHIGQKGLVESVEGNHLVYVSAKKKYTSLKKHAFVIGKGKEAIKLD